MLIKIWQTTTTTIATITTHTQYYVTTYWVNCTLSIFVLVVVILFIEWRSIVEKRRLRRKRTSAKRRKEWKSLRENPLYSLNAFEVMRFLLSGATAMAWFQFDLCCLADTNQSYARAFSINLHFIHFIHTLKPCTANTVTVSCYTVNNNITIQCTSRVSSQFHEL